MFARQPIFNLNQSVYGYELLFRDDEQNSANIIDGTLASAQVIANAFTEMDILKSLNNKLGFINYTFGTSSAGLPEFAKERLVVELLEDFHQHEDTLTELTRLKNIGYRVALDDFVWFESAPELLNVVDIVKIDVLALSPKMVAEHCALLKPYDVVLLAEKVEDQITFETCKKLGFELFQGYFFAKPQIIFAKKLPNSKTSVLNLMLELYRPDASLECIHQTIKKDSVLSVKILKLVNSSLYRRANNIESILQACTLLGRDKIRNWATLISFGNMTDKALELQRESLYRGYLCQYLVCDSMPDKSETAFTLGLLSCLDAYFDRPMNELIEELPISDELKQAMEYYQGDLGLVLHSAIHCGQGRWNKIEFELLRSLNISDKHLQSCHIKALESCDQVMREFVN